MKLEYMEAFQFPKLKEDKNIIKTYSDAELKLLLKKPNIKEVNFLEFRNWVVCNFFLSTGARARTIVNIRIQDIDFENDLIRYDYTKNCKTQLVPLSNSLKVILIEYLAYRKGSPEDYLLKLQMILLRLNWGYWITVITE